MRDRANHPERQAKLGRGLRACHDFSCLLLLLLLPLLLRWRPALAAPEPLEDLRYRVAVWAWADAARIRVTLKNQGHDRLVAEVLGETRGLVKLISGNHRERLQTEMIWQEGRLVPLVYREESWRHGKRAFKEYRFDYTRARLTLWEWHAGKGLLKKWETAMPRQVYDPLTAFYDCRLQVLGPTGEGETSIIMGIPYPRPEVLEVRLGPETKDGRQVMVSLGNSIFEESRGVVFAIIDVQQVPQRAWATVSGVTVKATLLPGSVIMPTKLPGVPASGLVADRPPPSEIIHSIHKRNRP